jgi:hypothetical protein
MAQPSPPKHFVINVVRRVNVGFAIDLAPGNYTITWSRKQSNEGDENVEVHFSGAGRMRQIQAHLQPGVHTSVAITAVETYGAERLYAIHMPSQDLIFRVSPFKDE